MIHIYEKGQEMVDEYKTYLDENKYQATFFYVDGKLIEKSDKVNYAIKAKKDNEVLLMMKALEWDSIFYGSPNLVEELIDFIIENNYEFKHYLCDQDLGLKIQQYLKEKYHIEYDYTIRMDFMEAFDISEPSCKEVSIANETDIDEIHEMMQSFLSDCNLLDKITREEVETKLPGYRLIKVDGKIVSVAHVAKQQDNIERISAVYTRDEYRGKGYCKKVVNACKNEILQRGNIATLNVDQNNPISNHVYSSIGFKKVFSQGEFRRIDD